MKSISPALQSFLFPAQGLPPQIFVADLYQFQLVQGGTLSYCSGDADIDWNGATWGAWQKYAPGRYLTQAFKARMQLATSDPTVIALLTDFSFGVDVPDRDDHYTGLAVPSWGLALSFTPDGGTAPVPFNGGPGSARVPAVQITILNAQAGDQAVLSSLTLAGCAIAIVNGGLGVARTVNVLAQGY